MLLLPLFLAPLALGGCATTFSGPRSGATAQQLDACESRADEIYALRNPSDAMRADNEAGAIGSPFSGATGRSAPDLLAGQHSREKLVNQCLNGQTGTAPDSAPRPPAPP
jgi:hypothetical protein